MGQIIHVDKVSGMFPKHVNIPPHSVHRATNRARFLTHMCRCLGVLIIDDSFLFVPTSTTWVAQLFLLCGFETNKMHFFRSSSTDLFLRRQGGLCPVCLFCFCQSHLQLCCLVSQTEILSSGALPVLKESGGWIYSNHVSSASNVQWVFSVGKSLKSLFSGDLGFPSAPAMCHRTFTQPKQVSLSSFSPFAGELLSLTISAPVTLRKPALRPPAPRGLGEVS